MKNITVILPLHKLDEDYLTMLNNALSSVELFKDDVKVMIVAPTHITKQLVNLTNTLEITVVENEGDTTYQNQMNVALEKCDTEWFSILEVDDEYTKIWLPSTLQHINEYKEHKIFLNIVKDVNSEGHLISYTNESVWAYGFTDKIGELDLDTLLEYQNYQVSGGVFHTETVKQNGGLYKNDLELAFNYEFLLRMLNNDVKIMVVPRIGYKHVNFREDSLFWLYKNDEIIKLSEEESRSYIERAKKEYLFNDKQDVKDDNS